MGISRANVATQIMEHLCNCPETGGIDGEPDDQIDMIELTTAPC